MRNAVQKRQHKERGQLPGREKWGILEKHKVCYISIAHMSNQIKSNQIKSNANANTKYEYEYDMNRITPSEQKITI